MRPTRRLLAATAATVTAAMLLSGCAQVYPGEAQRDPGFDAGAVYPNVLDTGNYQTKPREAMGTAGSVKIGGLLEARRVAENTVLPFQVDPTLNNPGMTWVIKDGSSLASDIGNDDIEAAVKDHRFVSGFDVNASDGDYKTAQKSLSNAVTIFATPDDVAAAAPAVIAAAEPSDGGATTIPRYPDTRAWVEQEHHTEKTPRQIVQAFTVRGPYLLVQTAKAPSATEAAELVAATLDQQIPLIDSFVPTPYDQLAALPMDPTGLWARLLADPEPKVTTGVYGPHGAVAFYEPPADYQRMFTETGADLFGFDQTFVVRTRDAAGAAKLLDFIIGDYRSNGYEEISGISGLPGAHCLQKTTTSADRIKVDCMVAADRYVVTAEGQQETDVKQITAAQFLMLIAK